MGIKAKFAAGLLSVTGDNADDAITVNRNAAQILINGGAIPAQEGQPTLANTTEIDVFGRNGNFTRGRALVPIPPGPCRPRALEG